MTIFGHTINNKYLKFMKLSTKVILIIGSLVTLLISLFLILLIFRINKQNEENMLSTSRSIFNNILITRKWVSDFDGIFVNKQPGMEPNPFLPHPDLITNTGDTLFLKNPALVTRELSELSKLMGGEFSYHITSEKYINPLNVPDEFETQALTSFKDSTTKSKNEYYQVEEVDGKHYFRYFSPLYIDYSCLNCHSGQDYQYGDLRGGISVILSIDSYLEDRRSNLILLIGFAIITIAVLSAIIFAAIQKAVIKPLGLIEESTQAMQEGNYDSSLDLSSNDEIGSLARAFNTMAQKIKYSTQKLKLSENKYKKLIEHSIESIAIVRQDGKIIECNNNMKHITGFSKKELKGLNIFELIDNQNKKSIQLPTDNILIDEVKTEHFETILISKDKLEIPVEIYRIKEFSFDQDSKLSIVYIRDLSERKQIEKYSIQAEKMFALGQLSSGIAHEIRNPLFALNNNIEYINSNPNKDKAFEEIYPEIKTSVERIQKTVATTLDFAKTHKSKYVDIDINNVIKESIALVKKQFTKSDIQIDLKLDNKIKPIKGDPHQLQQVFVNLLLNSFQAIINHSGTVSIITKNEAKHLKISIKDTGKGIPSRELNRIFDPFYSTFQDGTGLGLAIVQRILEQHNSIYKVESEEMIGTTFAIKFRY